MYGGTRRYSNWTLLFVYGYREKSLLISALPLFVVIAQFKVKWKGHEILSWKTLSLPLFYS